MCIRDRSFLKKDEQENLFATMESEEATPSLSQAQRMKQLSPVSYTHLEFCRCRESDQTYMDKLFIPIQGCLLEVVREQYTDFYRDPC